MREIVVGSSATAASIEAAVSAAFAAVVGVEPAGGASDFDKPKWTDAALRRVAAMRNAGSTVQEVADAFGVTYGAARSASVEARRRGYMA